MFSTKFDRRGGLQADTAIVHPKESTDQTGERTETNEIASII
jgi:hypothetical protein